MASNSQDVQGKESSALKVVQLHEVGLSPVSKQCSSCHVFSAALVAATEPQPLS